MTRTLARTTNAPVAIRDVDVGELDLSEIRRWDAGIRLGSGWAGLQVPTLEEVLAMLSKSPDRQLYLEPKAVELAALKERVQRFRVDQQVLFVHASQEALVEIRTLFGNRPTMTWLSGDVEQIGSGFERLAVTDFQGISQLQVHLHVRAERPAIDYLFSAEQIQAMQARLARVGVDLQLRPFAMDAASLRRLLDLGVRWFVSDSPRRFSETLRAAKELPHV
ncbi:MAG: hypothetical protein HC802_14680 [Caldilineaceae bacterium]|nr:hypothetical protein [Caldilineaceae bacterium]